MAYKSGYKLKTAFDTYTIQHQKGQGASGWVYEVHDSENVAYAAKILDPAKATAGRLKRFKNEIHFCTKQNCPNIIQVQASGVTDDGATFYVMPLYSGTLRSLITAGIPHKEVLRYFGQVLDGVEAAHLQKVWHRDLKPENVLFSANLDSLVVADFGIAHFEEEELLTAVQTKDHERLANFLYSAPEQRAPAQVVNEKADVYALGLILNEMFCKAVPQGTAFRKITDVTAEYPYLDTLVDLMLRQDPTLRPTVTEVKRELIARGNEFISEQRLSAYRSEVIPETEVDDPIIRSPITIVSKDYQQGRLVFKLSRIPPPNWIMFFQRPVGSYSFFHGAEPAAFGFNGDEADVPLGPGMDASQLVRYANSYIDLANQQYASYVVAEHQKRMAQQRESLRKRIQEEEYRQKVLAQIRGA